VTPVPLRRNRDFTEVGALRAVVPPEQLPDAAAAEQARYATVTLVGPSAGGPLFGLGRSWPFVADVISYAFSIASLLAIRTPFQEERELDTTRLRAQIAEGFRWLWQQPFLRTCALIFAGTNFGFQGIFLTFVVIAKRHGLSSVARNLALLGQPLGPLVAGFLLGATSARMTVLVFAVTMGGLALWATLSLSIRRAPSLAELTAT
jgi:hypothetical protein